MKEHIARWSYLSINLFGKIFLQGFSCYGPLNWQRLPCFTQQLKGKISGASGRPRTRSLTQAGPLGAWSWSRRPFAAPGNAPIWISAALSIPGSFFCFPVFGEGKVGKGNYLWIRFRICYPFCVSVSVLSFLSLPSSCIHVQNAEWEQADPTAVAYLPVSTSWGGRMEFRLINYPEFWHLF